jgi:hypothetical protein
VRTFLLQRRRRWVARAFGRNPLLRWTDRAEACVVLAAMVLTLVVCPLCVVKGADVYRTHARLYAEQSSARHRVTAFVAATGQPAREPRTAASVVLAVWAVGADGARGGESQRMHAEWVRTNRTVVAGDRVDIWVDDAGALVDAPIPLMQAGFDAVGVGAGIGGAAILVLMTGVGVLRSPLNRIRQAQLDREIKRFASGGTTNRS